MSIATRRGRSSVNVWPGYVDALAALLMLVIFVLLVFTFSQFMLSHILSSQESELTVMSRQLDKLTEALGLTKQRNEALKVQLDDLTGMVTDLTDEKFQLSSKLENLQAESATDKERLSAQLLQIASLQQDIDKLRQLRNKLEGQIGDLAGQLDSRSREADQLRDRSKVLEAELADANERTHLAQKDVEEKTIRLEALSALVASQKEALEKERQLTASSQAELTLLSRQMTTIKEQLKTINEALAQAEAEKRTQEKTIEELGSRLNVELARRVNELSKYRSVFFQQLSKLLVDNPYIQVKGDRFVFQAELLFPSGSADIGPEGKKQLDILARVLRDVMKVVPEQIDWILRIDGHTDRAPIRSGAFPSNWELSTARALSVVLYLSKQGIPSRRMAAAGFGPYHPVDEADTPEAYAKNRRIEIKLTSR